MKQYLLTLLLLVSVASFGQFSLSDVGGPAILDPLLTMHSPTVSTRNLTAESLRSTQSRNGVVVRRTLTIQCVIGNRASNTASILPTTNLAGVGDGGWTRNGNVLTKVTSNVLVPHVKTKEQGTGVEIHGNPLQGTGNITTTITLNGNSANEVTVNRPPAFEFFMSNPFPLSFTAAQIDSAIEDGVANSCNWVIKQGTVIWFEVTPARVIRDVRRRVSSITNAEALAQALRVERTYSVQPPDRMANIFPRLTVNGNVLSNTTIINGQPWQLSPNIKSATGQTFTWQWIVGVFNDCAVPDGPLANNIGPAIYDIGRCDWEFFNWSDVTEFTLVAHNGPARIDRNTMTLFYNPNERSVFTIQLRGPSDKSPDYIGYLNPATGLYTTDLPTLVKQFLP